MKDRFKFRVWNEDKEEYIGHSYCDWYEEYYAISYHGGLLDIFNSDNCTCIKQVDYKVVVEQCTGLKDKNGNLIYEGDIINHYAFLDYVVYRNGVFTTNINTSNQPLSMHGFENIEVIGNIHENPELLA